jgi:hypothetical protein
MARRVKKIIPIEAIKEINDTITMEELHEAVKKGKPNKATGEDGISQEFFKIMWDTIKDELLEVINQMYVNEITNNEKLGVKVGVPKTLRPTKPEEYRHLTLLNTDVKLLIKTLAKRISPWLKNTLHPSQHCGIKGRTIYEALGTIRETKAYTEYTKTPMCILSLDFREAFRNISHDYLFTLLEEYGYSDRFQRCIRNI